MRVLFTSPILEHPAAGGPQLRIENSIKALSRICELDVINRTILSDEMADSTAEFFQQYANEYHTMPRLPRQGGVARVVSLMERILNRIIDIRTARQADYILKHIDRRNIDILWFGFGNISYSLMKYIKSKRPNLKIVCDTDSVWSRFILRELPYVSGLRKFRVRREGLNKEKEERDWVRFCEVTTGVSEVDSDYYRSIAEEKERIHLFSNVIDVETYKIAPPPPTDFKAPSIYLAGSFGHYNSSMDTAARWMLDEVFPLVLKKHPDVHFYIVGNNSELNFGHLNDPSITVTGRLESVLPYLCNTDVALVPLKFESGTRFKILEAGACKVSLVSTVLGAEGIPVIDGEHILLADDPDGFANAIIRLLDDKELANKLAVNCHTLINEKFSVESLVDEVKNILEYLSHD
jgi:polysaccharide biosynthesis protein PslH